MPGLDGTCPLFHFQPIKTPTSSKRHQKPRIIDPFLSIYQGLPARNEMSKSDTAASVLKNKAFFRRQSTFKNWPLDERLSVWIEIVRHTAGKYDKYEYGGSDSPFALHIGSMLKHTLPDYGWPVADDKLQWDIEI